MCLNADFAQADAACCSTNRCFALRDSEYCKELHNTTNDDWYMLRVTVPTLSSALHSVLPTVRNESNTLLHMAPKLNVTSQVKHMHVCYCHLCRLHTDMNANKNGSTWAELCERDLENKLIIAYSAWRMHRVHQQKYCNEKDLKTRMRCGCIIDCLDDVDDSQATPRKHATTTTM